jgi:hypothetical protein
MAFLFKSKKNADKAQGAKDVAGSQSSLQSPNGRINEKQTTPASSVNNSINSLQGGDTPSPEQLIGRRGPSTEQQASDLPVSYTYRYFKCMNSQTLIAAPSFGMALRQRFNR